VLPRVGRDLLDAGVEPDQGGAGRAVLEAAPGGVHVAAGREATVGVRGAHPVPPGEEEAGSLVRTVGFPLTFRWVSC
jgi:hypothetical protein